MTRSAIDIYKNGIYLEKHNTWHQEDSPYKARLVLDAIKKNNLQFRTCADVGCGAGLVTELLAEYFPDVVFTGFDVSSDAELFWNERKKLNNLDYSNSDIFNASECYDLIICLDVFEHIEDYFKFLRNLLIKGKIFIFNIPLDMNILKLIRGFRAVREQWGHIHYFNDYTAVATLKESGYQIIDSHFSPYVFIRPRSVKQLIIYPFKILSLIFGKKYSSRVFGDFSLIVIAINQSAVP